MNAPLFCRPPLFFQQWIAGWIIAGQLVLPSVSSLPANAQAVEAPPPLEAVATPPSEPVTVNLQAPNVDPARIEPVFSDPPTDTEIWHSRIFSEPIIPSPGPASAEENRALVNALRAFRARASNDDVSALQEFLRTYPSSRWKISVLTQIGMVYRLTGYFSRALEAWEEVWRIGKRDTNYQIKVVVDLAAAELAALYSRLGRQEQLEPLFKTWKGVSSWF